MNAIPHVQDLSEYNPRYFKKISTYYGLRIFSNSRYASGYHQKTYEDFTLSFWQKLIGQNDIVLDVGSQYGIYSLIAAKKLTNKGRVYAFEPVKENALMIKKNSILNRLSTKISIKKIAISNNVGQREFIISDQSGCSSFYQPARSNAVKVISVPTTTLDEIFPKTLINAMKIDVEGEEINVLLGAKKCIRRSPNIIIFIEYNPESLTNAGRKPNELLAMIKNDLNFEIIVVDDYKRFWFRLNSKKQLLPLFKYQGHLNLICMNKRAAEIFSNKFKATRKELLGKKYNPVDNFSSTRTLRNQKFTIPLNYKNLFNLLASNQIQRLREIDILQENLKDQVLTNQRLDQALSESHLANQRLSSSSQELNLIKSSLSWRMVSFACRYLDKITVNHYWDFKQNGVVKKLIIIMQSFLGRESYDKFSRFFVQKFFPNYLGWTPFLPLSNHTLKNKARHPNINLFAHLTLDTGVGEAGRFFSNLFKTSKFLSSPVDLGTWTSEIKTKDWVKDRVPLYPVSFFVTSVTGLQTHMRIKLGARSYQNKYNIAYFHWEMPTVPENYLAAIKDIDEIWVPSVFCQDAFARFSPIPVVRIPWRPTIPVTRKFSRRDFGFKDSDFVFLFVYDGSHYPERKNPLGLLRAFAKAKLPSTVKLVIKVMNLTKKNIYHQKLLVEIKKIPNVYLWNAVFSREKILDLIAACNCYISLHRAEGFAATIFEAMSLSKPVIATGYSANTDYMTVNNSFPIVYKLVKLKYDVGPYKKGSVWAEPSLVDAAKLMNYVLTNPDQSRKIGARAKNDLERDYNFRKLQKITFDRLALIQKKLTAKTESVK